MSLGKRETLICRNRSNFGNPTFAYRELLSAAALGSIGDAVSAQRDGETENQNDKRHVCPMSDDSLLIRPLSDLFPTTSRWIYVDAASSGLLPETARERVSGVLEAQLLASFGENHALSMLQSCREFFARLIRAAATYIQLFSSSAGALDAVAARLDLRHCSNLVLCTALSRPSFAAYWREQARRHSLELREVAIDADGFAVAHLKVLVDGGTALVALPAVSHARGMSSSSSTVQPAWAYSASMYCVRASMA